MMWAGGPRLTWVVEVLHEPVLEDGKRLGAQVALLPPARAARSVKSCARKEGELNSLCLPGG